MYEREYDPVECPVADCDHEDDVRSVAAHVARTDDAGHEWDRLGYDGARDFVMTQKQSQRGAGESESVENVEMERASNIETASEAEADAHPDAEADDDAETPRHLDLEVGRDALVLLDLVAEYDFESLSDLDVFELANLYALCSHLKSSADTSRREVRDVLLDTVHDDREVESDFGTIQRRTYRRREVRDDRTVERTLREAGVDPESVRSYDTTKLREAVEDHDIDPEAVFEVEEREQIRRAEVDDAARRERFERLDESLRALAGERDEPESGDSSE